MKILLTGHSSFIGSHILHTHDEHYEVICTGKKENLSLCNKVTADAPLRGSPSELIQRAIFRKLRTKNSKQASECKMGKDQLGELKYVRKKNKRTRRTVCNLTLDKLFLNKATMGNL